MDTQWQYADRKDSNFTHLNNFLEDDIDSNNNDYDLTSEMGYNDSADLGNNDTIFEIFSSSLAPIYFVYLLNFL